MILKQYLKNKNESVTISGVYQKAAIASLIHSIYYVKLIYKWIDWIIECVILKHER